MTDQQLEGSAETPMDFSVHLAERLQLAPETVAAQLELWLLHYPRLHRTVAAAPAPGFEAANDLALHATAG